MKLNKVVIFNILFFYLFTSSIFCQDYIIRQDNQSDPFIVGISSRDAYKDSSFSSWFNSEYTNYKLNTKLLNINRNSFEGKVIKIVLGTLCIDSRREVPRFIKILDFIEFPSDKILFMNVDEEKKGLYDEIDGLEIEFVPTFIVYENGNEIGRIIESPINTLETDLIEIIKTSQ